MGDGGRDQWKTERRGKKGSVEMEDVGMRGGRGGVKKSTKCRWGQSEAPSLKGAIVLGLDGHRG